MGKRRHADGFGERKARPYVTLYVMELKGPGAWKLPCRWPKQIETAIASRQDAWGPVVGVQQSSPRACKRSLQICK